MAQDLATPFMEGLRIGAAMVQNLREVRQKQAQAESQAQIEQMKADLERRKAEMDQQSKAASLAMTFVANEKIQAPETKVKTFNSTILPFLNSLTPADQQIQPLKAWSDSATSLVKAMEEVNKLPDEIGPRERMAALAEQLAAYGLGEQALAAQQELAKPVPLEQQALESLPPEKRAAALQQKVFPAPQPVQTQVHTGVNLGGGMEGTIEKDPKTGAWHLVTVGGKEIKGKAKTDGGLKSLPADSAGKLSASVTALNMLNDPKMQKLLYITDAQGKRTINVSAFRQAQGPALQLGYGTPKTEVGQHVSRLLIALKEAILRPVSGAALSEQDLKETERRLDPSFIFKNPTVLEENLKWAEQQITGFTQLVDPTGEYRALLKPGGERPPLSSFERP